MLEAKVADPAEASRCEAERVYRQHYSLLRYLARQRYNIPENDSENLIHEVFLSYLSATEEIRNPRSWLVGAICNASRYYWRSSARTESLPADFAHREDPSHAGMAEQAAIRITVRETLGRLHEKCQTTLRLHYFDGCSAPEVAKKLETTNRYAEKLIHKCLKRAYEIYSGLMGVQR